MQYPQFEKDRFSMNDLVEIFEILRGENGCPWDREQTHESIRKNLIEETYEVLDAVDRKDVSGLREELGDLLMQVVFHTQMEQELGHFNMEDVITELCQKLIVRHPHIFGDAVAENSEKVLANWDQIKQSTKQQKTYTDTLSAVPANLPALMRATKIQQRAKRAGMDFENQMQTLDKLAEEQAELKEAIADGKKEAIAEELGDLLFAVCNVARFLKVDPEEALTRSSEKFSSRFAYVEAHAPAAFGQEMDKLSPAELDTLWNEAKKEGK